ncbi:MAG: hypothetical protein JWN02_2738 [Acidobacteria bacterium]|nr:hypothetical protein [Acidobacteriota bacterium]
MTPAKIRLGIEKLIDDPSPIRDKRVAVLSHQAAVTHELRRTVDCIKELPCDLRLIFGPEHGFWGVAQDMEGAAQSRDLQTGAEIISLYHDYPKRPKDCSPPEIAIWKQQLTEAKAKLDPEPQQLSGIEILLVDLQDVGVRFYTFANTMANCMKMAKQTGTKVIVLDRPNPIGGLTVEGNRFEDLTKYASFVGQFDIPVRHGMTIAELARYYAGTQPETYGCELEVIEMDGWERRYWWSETDLPWVPPSPNMPTLGTATVYPGMCLIEATEVSEGRGTTIPFELIGAPGIDAFELAERLQSLGLEGIAFRPQYFKPTFQKSAGKYCGGVQLHVTDRDSLQPYRVGLWCLKTLYDLGRTVPRSGPSSDFRFEWRQDAYEYEPLDERHALEQLVGTARFRQILESGDDAALTQWIAGWENEERDFSRQREEYLLY